MNYENNELNMGKITFKNKCSVPSWMPDRKKDFRENADSFFGKILSNSLLFKGKEIELYYFQQGVGSIVAKVSLSNGEVYVIKTTETRNRTIAEIKSYKAMSDNDINVPEVYEEGVIDEYPFFIMEYFEESTLQDKLNKGEMTIEEISEIKSEVFVNLKKISGKGYGWTTGYEDGVLQGNFSDIESFMNEWFGQEGVVEIATKHYPSIPWALELKKNSDVIIEENKNNESHFGSFDFTTAHFFATEPPTFFDSNPRLEPEYFDLAFALIPTTDISDNKLKLGKALVLKYERQLGPINKEEMLRALWLQTFRKATNLLLQPDDKRTKLGLHMLGILSEKGALEEYIKQYF